MDKIQTIIKFDGPALDGKTMDVAHLAPALLALSDLVKETNRYANGARAGVRVLVNADLEQKCFELNLELALTIWEKAKLLVADDRVQTAKEIAECIGIVGGSGYGLFRFIKWVRGRTIESVTVLQVVDGQNMVEIRVEGETDPVKITQSVYELYANQATRQKAVAVLAPLREEGYDSLEFYEEDNVFVEFQEDDLPLLDGSDLPEVIPQNINTSTIRTGVKIRKPAYEGSSSWTVLYKRAINAAFDHKEWLKDFQDGKIQAPPGSSIDVDLEEQYITNENGEIIGDPTYRIKHVHGVKLPMKQRQLEFKKDQS
jgi:hypothetical protein